MPWLNRRQHILFWSTQRGTLSQHRHHFCWATSNILHDQSLAKTGWYKSLAYSRCATGRGHIDFHWLCLSHLLSKTQNVMQCLCQARYSNHYPEWRRGKNKMAPTSLCSTVQTSREKGVKDKWGCSSLKGHPGYKHTAMLNVLVS